MSLSFEISEIASNRLCDFNFLSRPVGELLTHCYPRSNPAPSTPLETLSRHNAVSPTSLPASLKSVDTGAKSTARFVFWIMSLQVDGGCTDSNRRMKHLCFFLALLSHPMFELSPLKCHTSCSKLSYTLCVEEKSVCECVALMKMV